MFRFRSAASATLQPRCKVAPANTRQDPFQDESDSEMLGPRSSGRFRRQVHLTFFGRMNQGEGSTRELLADGPSLLHASCCT